jgi:predicted DNA-binding protein (MmcQ/YjbR family)
LGLTLERLSEQADTQTAAVTLTRMPHPIMFRDDDLGLAEVRKICLSFPGAFEKISWGRPVFCAPKMFVMYGGSVKTDVKGEYDQYPYSILVKVDDSDRRALEQDGRFFFPAYMGPFGWLGMNFAARKKIDWDEVRELVDASFRLTAPKKLIKQLDEV